MTTPTPDKLAIPEAAVEAAMEKLHWQLPTDDGTGEMWRIVRSALAAALPHMPDRGYAEVGVKALEWEERAWWDGTKSRSEPFVWRGLGLGCRYEIDASRKDRVVARHNDKSFGEFQTEDEAKAAAQADFETRIRSALIAPPAPADNAEHPSHIMDFDDFEAWLHAQHREVGITPALQKAWDDYKAAVGANAFDATPSLAEPSEAEIETAIDRAELRPRETTPTDHPSEAEVRAAIAAAEQTWDDLPDDPSGAAQTVFQPSVFRAALLAARRVRPSPIDKDARDGVLEEAAKIADREAIRASQDGHGDIACYAVRNVAYGIRALQSQQER